MDPFIGEVRMFAGTYAPMGWEFCNGQLLNISQYDSLFALIGTTYGGDGVSTFALPDLRGRTPIHMGQGPNLSPRNLGDSLGRESVLLAAAQMPTHYHSVHASSKAGVQAAPNGSVWAVVTGENRYTQAAPTVSMSPNATTPAGGGQAHDNMMPFQAVSFIIATEGVFPPRD